jgi:hypothetical protein
MCREIGEAIGRGLASQQPARSVARRPFLLGLGAAAIAAAAVPAVLEAGWFAGEDACERRGGVRGELASPVRAVPPPPAPPVPGGLLPPEPQAPEPRVDGDVGPPPEPDVLTLGELDVPH